MKVDWIIYLFNWLVFTYFDFESSLHHHSWSFPVSKIQGRAQDFIFLEDFDLCMPPRHKSLFAEYIAVIISSEKYQLRSYIK